MRLPHYLAAMLAAISLVSTATPAATPRDQLTTAAFQTTDKKTAKALVDAAIANSETALATNPGDHEAQLGRAMGIGYRARLTKNPGDAKTARKLLETMIAANPRDAEAQLFLGGWHLDAVAAGFLATTVLGAKRDAGLDGINKAVALGGNRAFYRGLASMMRIRLDTDDIGAARALAEQAAVSPTPTLLDRIAKHDADLMLVPLRAGDGKTAASLARKLLPFGRIN